MGRVVVGFGGKGKHPETMLGGGIPYGVGGKEGNSFVIARKEGDGRSRHDGVVQYHADRDAGKGVRFVQAQLRNPDAVPDRGFGLVHNVHDFFPGLVQLAFRPQGGFFPDGLVRIKQLEESGQRERGSRDKDHHDTPLGRDAENLFCHEQMLAMDKDKKNQVLSKTRKHLIALVWMKGLEPSTSWSLTRCATNCATSRFGPQR